VTDDAVTMPTIDDSDLDAAISDMAAARPWLDGAGLSATFQCVPGAENLVLSQSPAAGSTIDATETVSVVLSSGLACRLPIGVRMPGTRIGL